MSVSLPRSVLLCSTVSLESYHNFLDFVEGKTLTDTDF